MLVNAALGFREEMKAKNALAELTNQMESSIPCWGHPAPRSEACEDSENRCPKWRIWIVEILMFLQIFILKRNFF